jgi:hypothetical protein
LVGFTPKSRWFESNHATTKDESTALIVCLLYLLGLFNKPVSHLVILRGLILFLQSKCLMQGYICTVLNWCSGQSSPSLEYLLTESWEGIKLSSSHLKHTEYRRVNKISRQKQFSLPWHLYYHYRTLIRL